MIHCLFRYSTDAGYIKFLWRFNPLLLSLLKELSLSLLRSHSSWGPALDLALPWHVGHPLASVLHPDRKGLKEQLIMGLWLTQAWGEGGVRNAGRACSDRVTLQQPEVLCVLPPGKLSLDHGTLAVVGYTGSWEGRCG